jgi:hypothetical protein
MIEFEKLIEANNKFIKKFVEQWWLKNSCKK